MNAEPQLPLQSTVMHGDVQRTRRLRQVLMLLVPLILVLVGAAVYLAGGRFVSTDNAYIKADIASVSPEVSGNVTSVLAAENQKVTKGQPLLVIDDLNYRIALAAAEANLRAAVSNIDGAKARYRQKQQSLAMMKTNVAFADREYKRQATLASSNYVAAAKLDEAKHTLKSAQQNIALLQQEEAEILASLENDPNIDPTKHPTYLQALAARESAQHYIDNATVMAPFDGVVSQLPRVGDYARTGAPILSIVSTAGVWIEANFKETDLTQMKIGQPVDVDVDTYPGRTFHGHVTSISQATGAEFAVLPAQNSTGNWIKVVQRVPVRISVDEQQGAPPLRAGMSVTAEVDTGVRRFDTYFGASAAAP